MKDLWTVSSFTFQDLVKRKSFIISNIIILLIIVIGFNIPRVLGQFVGEDENFGTTKTTIIDYDNIFGDSLEKTFENNPEYNVDIVAEKWDLNTVKEKIKEGEIEEALYITKQDESISVQYVVESEGLATSLPQDLVNLLKSAYQNKQIQDLGIAPEQIAVINMPFEVNLTAVEENEAAENIFPMMMLSIVLFYAIYFFAYQVSSSITTEKTSKIIETLVTSTSPRTIVLGKTLGIGLAGVMQTVVTVVVALICAKLFLDPAIIDAVLGSINFTPVLAIITIAYYILGYSLFALLYALTGSTVAKPEDVQSANGPVAILAVIGFYLSYFTMMNPTSNLNQIAAIVPISSPFCMPFRVMMGLATTGEILLSLAILVITILIVAKVSIKIYSSAILNYGNRMNLKDLFRIYKNKND